MTSKNIFLKNNFQHFLTFSKKSEQKGHCQLLSTDDAVNKRGGAAGVHHTQSTPHRSRHP